MKSAFFPCLVVAFALAPALLLAQDTAQITGTVTDPSGAAVANAKVVLTSEAQGTSHSTTTNGGGGYLFAALPVGKYDMNVTAPGFKKYEARGIVLDVEQKARNDVTLAVGASQETVNVEGTNVAQVELQSSELSGTITGKEVNQLELNGRNFTQLVTLTPGVSNQTGQDEGTVGVYGNVSFSVNGGRVEYNNWEVDGGDNMDNGSNSTLNVYPSLDAIAEFKVLTSNYGAQYGRNGSGTIEVETKAGTNAFHGDVYEYVRNDAFNAQNFFDSPTWGGSGVTPAYKKNDYGYTIGGPVFIPNHYNTSKTKTFFFWSEEWRKDVVPGQTFHLPVPSMAERAGDFSDLCNAGSPDCPNTGPNVAAQPAFAANQAVSSALLGMIPAPNGAGASTCVPGSTSNPCFFTASPAQGTNWREELVRVDQNITDNLHATFRFIHDSWQTTTATPLWTNETSFPTIETAFKGPGVGLVARLTDNISPTLLNEFVFSYTADHIILNDVGTWQRPSGFDANFTDLFPGNGGGVLPGISLVDPNGAYGNFGEDAGYIPNGIYNSNPTYTYRDNVTKIVGSHNLQFGAYAVTAEKNEFGGELAAGSFPGFLTFNPNSDAASTGNPFADLLLGNIASFGQQNQLIKYYNRYKILEPYFQDDWHATRKLTLNLGLRMSLYGTYREKLHQAFNFDPAHYVAGQTTVDESSDVVTGLTADNGAPSVSDLPNGIVQCGVTSGVPVGCQQGHLFNPAPRIGFAYDPRGDGKTAIRGGYGIFYEHTNGNEANTESLENSAPLALAEQKVNILGYANINTSAAAQQLPLNAVAIPTKATWPYVQQWHLDIQHEIARNTVATIGYVGTKGTHLVRESDLNQLFPLPLSQDPYVPGEAIGPNDCGTTFVNGVPTAATTPSGVPITGAAALHLGIAACGTNPDPFRPFPGYTTITHIEEAASSIYHGLQASIRRNVGQLQLSVAYTYSHSIDDSSDRSDSSFVNSYNFATNRASSNFDERHVLNFSYVWDLPFFKGPGLSNKLLGGWEFSGITGISTGTPFSPVIGSDNAGVANGISGALARPDIVGNPTAGPFPAPDTGFPRAFYNVNAYAAPRGLTFGDAGRNSLTNPRYTNFDMALFKHFAVNERMSFEFRAEAFNVFNHVEWLPIAGDSGSAASNYGVANNTFGSPGFLQVSAAHNPRILQLALKFLF
jgi:Carboxypeptidase regulatory-like domain